jgi:Polyketide cyclase / dehydrase and lipid transport
LPVAEPFAACPIAVVEAPIEVVWDLLTHMERWDDFYDLRVVHVDPPGAAVPGQRMRGESGPRWLHIGVSFEFQVIDEPHHKLEFDVHMPLGLTVHEVLDCVPLAADRCRVNYHCNFGIPDGWRGFVIRTFLGRELTNGPDDSIQRLKRAAEAAYQKRCVTT